MRDDFCVFILTHGRPDNIKTLKMLKKSNYTGKTYIVIDDEDDCEQEYRKKYGERVLQFNKLKVSKTFDTMDLSKDRRTIVYARNACFDLAKQVDVKYFLELDDDYTSLLYRCVKDEKLKSENIKDADRLFSAMCDFLDDTNSETVALSQGGDFIGGAKNKRFDKKILRKAMNTFFCRTDKRFDFVGRINEDVNTYVSLGKIGKLLLSITDCMITQTQTQKTNGGMTDVYLDSGTYLKSFYSVMISPSCVHIREMGDKHKRLHHHVEWRYCVPKILNEKYKYERIKN